jgi:uncharacterized membrane protein
MSEAGKPPARRKRLDRHPRDLLVDAEPDAPPGAQRSPSSSLHVIEEHYAEATSGPIPSARELLRYKDVDPDAPRIILAEFRAESAHRRKLEWEIVTRENRRADRGQIFALAVLVLGFLIGGTLVYFDHDIAGTSIIGADLIAAAALFLRVQVENSKPRPGADAESDGKERGAP